MTTTAIITLCVVLGVVVVVALLLLGRSIDSVTLRLFGRSEAHIKSHTAGASAVGAKSGRDITVENQGPGTATADNATAGRDVTVKNQGPR